MPLHAPVVVVESVVVELVVVQVPQRSGQVVVIWGPRMGSEQNAAVTPS